MRDPEEASEVAMQRAVAISRIGTGQPCGSVIEVELQLQFQRAVEP
ncbi:MAG: hypothetical protein M0Z46_17000 [Actinomycetota bacterium]|jgi:hypothetical protein|nr:hypothetical protein [Actinomycetota bacterium]